MARKSPVESSPDTLVQLDPSVILMEDNARYSTEVSNDEAAQMCASIMEVGRIMEPVGVTVLDPSVNGFTHRLRYGFRRVAGALLANESGAGVQVPAIILHDADAVGTLREQVSENVVRKSLSLMDIAVAAQKMLDAGMSRQDVREVFKRPAGTKGRGVAAASNAWLNMVLSLLELPAAIQKRIHVGDIGLAAAYRLMKAPADKRLAILEAAEKETERVRETEEKEEKRFAAIEEKITEAEKKRGEATQAYDNATAEVELAEQARTQAEEKAAQLYTKEQELKRKAASAKTEEQKQSAKDALRKASEARKGAETDAKSAESKLTNAQKALAKAKEAQDKAAKAAEENRKKLEQAQATQAAKAPKAAGKKGSKVSPKDIDKAAKAAGVESGSVKLSGPQMRKVIDELSLISSYPKVAAVGKLIKECFDGVTTDGQMVKKLATLLGEQKTSRK